MIFMFARANVLLIQCKNWYALNMALSKLLNNVLLAYCAFYGNITSKAFFLYVKRNKNHVHYIITCGSKFFP